MNDRAARASALGFTASQQDNPAPLHFPYRTFSFHPTAASCKPLSKQRRGEQPSPCPDACSVLGYLCTGLRLWSSGKAMVVSQVPREPKACCKRKSACWWTYWKRYSEREGKPGHIPAACSQTPQRAQMFGSSKSVSCEPQKTQVVIFWACICYESTHKQLYAGKTA